MKIIKLEEFLKLPEGVIYSKYEPCIFGDIHIKGESWNPDFLCCSLVGNIASDSEDEFDKMCELAESGEDVNLCFKTYYRDGIFNEDQLFAVYNKKDIQCLIDILKESLRI